MKLKAVLFILLLFSLVDSAQNFVVPTKEDVGVFQNEIRTAYDVPIFTVGPIDRLLVLFEDRHYYQIKKADGQTGWIEKQFVVPAVKSKTFVFDSTNVAGYFDSPVLMYIIDANIPDVDPIKLNRSFAGELRFNVDMETVERQTTK
jgi:hypothetical protein